MSISDDVSPVCLYSNFTMKNLRHLQLSTGEYLWKWSWALCPILSGTSERAGWDAALICTVASVQGQLGAMLSGPERERHKERQ